MRRFAFVTLAGLAGCSDPATEAAIDLQKGLYEVTVGGGTFVSLKGSKITDRLCYDSYDATAFKQLPLNKISPLVAECAPGTSEPVGNSLKGSRTCSRPARGDSPGSDIRIAYEGQHDATSFTVRGTVAQGSDESASAMHLGSGEFRILGKRVSDC